MGTKLRELSQLITTSFAKYLWFKKLDLWRAPMMKLSNFGLPNSKKSKLCPAILLSSLPSNLNLLAAIFQEERTRRSKYGTTRLQCRRFNALPLFGLWLSTKTGIFMLGFLMEHSEFLQRIWWGGLPKMKFRLSIKKLYNQSQRSLGWALRK